VTRMPAGYDLRQRSRGLPTLVRLARRLPLLPVVTFQHVKSHDGHLLNEAADALAAIARRHTDRVEIRARAERLVASFLIDWHATKGGGGLPSLAR